MRILLTLAGALALVSGAALAQTPAAPPSSDATAAGGALSLDTPIETIAANPAGKTVLDKDLPGLTTHPAYDQFKGMSLKEVAPMSQGAITDAMLAKVGADLAALPK
jgi:hypothetical protein